MKDRILADFEVEEVVRIVIAVSLLGRLLGYIHPSVARRGWRLAVQIDPLLWRGFE